MTTADLADEELQDLADELADRHSWDRRSVHQRMADALADMTAITKKRSRGVSYAFRSIDDVMDALHPVLARHGLFPTPQVVGHHDLREIPGTPDKNGNPRTQWQASFLLGVRMFGPGGDHVDLGPIPAQSHDYGDKAVYQATQNAFKYVLLDSFMVPTEEAAYTDMDGRPASDTPRFDPAAFARSETERFARWSLEERRGYWKVAGEELRDEGQLLTAIPRTIDEGRLVIERMSNYYEEGGDSPAETGNPES